MLVLSLFPGIGLLDMAFEECGFCVVRGPDLLWGGDIYTFHVPSGHFDGVIGGPPCQAFSRLRYLVEYNGYQIGSNLIPEFERIVCEAQPEWFLMENVPDAPLPEVPGYIVHNDLVQDMTLGGATSRTRRFSFGTKKGRKLYIKILALWRVNPEPTVCASGGYRRVPVAIGGSGKVKSTKGRDRGYIDKRILADAIRDQGLPEGFLEKSPLTVKGKYMVIGNGVPLATGRAVAKAVMEACLSGDRRDFGGE